MFDFFANAFRTVVGLITGSWQSAITAVVNWVNSIEYAHYGYWHTVAGNVLNGWQEMTRSCLLAMQGLQSFMFAQGLFDYVISKQQIPWLANWLSWLGNKVSVDLSNAVNMLRREYRAGDQAQQDYTKSVLEWVIVHVLGFLLNILDTAIGWIDGIGSTMWHYFQDLTAFAELLFWYLIKSIETHAWDVAEVLGEFLFALVVKNLARFATLLETIVDAVL